MPVSIMADAPALHDAGVLVNDAYRVLLACPVNPSHVAHLITSPVRLTDVGGEVPWRVLTDGALTAQLPVVAQGTSTERREALVSSWPSERASAAGALPPFADTKKDDQ